MPAGRPADGGGVDGTGGAAPTGDDADAAPETGDNAAVAPTAAEADLLWLGAAMNSLYTDLLANGKDGDAEDAEDAEVVAAGELGLALPVGRPGADTARIAADEDGREDSAPEGDAEEVAGEVLVGLLDNTLPWLTGARETAGEATAASPLAVVFLGVGAGVGSKSW